MKDLFGHDKVEEAIERLRMFEPPEGYYGATSFGKDSIVIMELCRLAKVKVDWHTNITGIDPPELIYFGRKYYSEVQRHLPKETIWQLIRRKKMPPTRGKRFCCKFLKEANGEGRRVLTGIRAEESKKRAERRMVEQCYRDKSKTYVNIIIDWMKEDVWDFIKSRNLPYCSLYDEGFKRLGCVGCPYGNIKKDFARWPKIAEAWKRTIFRAWENRSHLEKGFKTPEDMWKWYVSGRHYAENPDQSVMFE